MITQADDDICFTTKSTYTGAQSALVVNTGDNTLSIVPIGTYPAPSGTIAVGNQPVAAAINPAQNLAYIANYGDGTISEVDLVAMQQTRTLSVMSNPTTVAFDSSGTLWVGGQGSLDSINISNWSIASSTAIDGTINGMSYDNQQGVFVQAALQNGSMSSPSAGRTGANQVLFSPYQQTSYTTQISFNPSTGASIVAPFAGDNMDYSNSLISSYLAFPAQTAVTPPIYSPSTSSTASDLTAVVTGRSFTVSEIASGSVLVQGTMPFPIRGVALTPNMVYFTIPESGSLVTLPIQLPQ